MRPLLILAIFLFAGCTAPEDENDALFGYCPTWTQGLETLPASVSGEESKLLVPWVNSGPNGTTVAYEINGNPLDMYLIRITQVTGNGTGDLRATHHDSGARLLIRDVTSDRPMQPVVQLDENSVGMELEIILSDFKSEGDPSRLMLSLDGDLNVKFDVTFMYRVCGE